MHKYSFVLICLLLAFTSKADNINNKTDSVILENKFDSYLKKSSVSVSYQNLRSTHIDHFTGYNLMIAYNFKPKFSLGIGFENTYGQRHDDNGLILSEIRLVPLILDARFLFSQNKWIKPFIELSTGITFMKYFKKVKVPPGSSDITETEGEFFYGLPVPVQQKGWYTFVGGGTYFKIGIHFMPYLGIGFKGYNMSPNVYVINPRGLNFVIGCKF